VIGTGADIVYPARNRLLAHQIAAEGCIVSEYSLGTPAIASNFPRRNRIISGLTKGVGGGSRCAVGFFNYGKDGGGSGAGSVCDSRFHPFAVSKGCHQLIGKVRNWWSLRRIY
jgi:DNA processing protein